MQFDFESRIPDSPFVEAVWHTQSNESGVFDSLAESHWGLVITKQQANVTVSLLGPQTFARTAPVPEGAEITGIVFKLDTIMPQLAAKSFVNAGIDLHKAAKDHFWLHGVSWQVPDFDNIDTFVADLVHNGVLVHEPLVANALVEEQVQGLSQRSMQRRFLHATGMTRSTVRQIERARSALLLLQQGTPTVEVIDRAGYYDQSHLIRSLIYYLGQRPTNIDSLSDWRKLLVSIW